MNLTRSVRSPGDGRASAAGERTAALADPEAMTFYEVLGFTVDERWEDKGMLLGVMLRAGKSQIGLNQDDWKKGRDRKKGIGVRLSISTPQNVDEIARRAKSAGITLKSEPQDTAWKSRAFEVIDPSGFLLTIFSEVRS